MKTYHDHAITDDKTAREDAVINRVYRRALNVQQDRNQRLWRMRHASGLPPIPTFFNFSLTRKDEYKLTLSICETIESLTPES